MRWILAFLGQFGITRIGLTWSTALPTGYTVSRADTLEAACRGAVERFKPKDDGTTYCNIAVNHIACAMGYRGFVGLLANEIFRRMGADAEFSEVSGAKAKELADLGELVIAGAKGTDHGHVAVVMPGRPLVFSRKWGKDAPALANVGKSNSIFGANYAFVDEPKYYAWIREGFGNEKPV